MASLRQQRGQYPPNMGVPTMEGFAWSGADGPPHNTLPGNGWCLRDAICTLFGWPPGSPDWAAFQEYPSWGDTHRLIAHLGLVAFDPEQLS